MCEEFTPPRDSRDFLSRCIKLLKMPQLQTIWGKSAGHIYAWAADTRSNGEVRENPFEMLEDLVGFLSAHSAQGKKLAQWPARYYCGLVGLDAQPCAVSPTSDRSWVEELLDDEGPWFRYREACKDFRAGTVGPEVVKYWEGELIREIRETTIKVLQKEG